jgi:hypothetical protein
METLIETEASLHVRIANVGLVSETDPLRRPDCVAM